MTVFSTSFDPKLWLFGFALFLATLQSFHYYALGGAVLPYLGAAIFAVMALAVFAQKGLETRVWGVGLVSFGLMAASGLAVIAIHGEYKSAFGIILSASMLLVVPTLLPRIQAERALSAVLSIHIGLFVVQVAWWFASENYLDYLLLSDLDSRWSSNKGYRLYGHLVPRFTGAFTEPATYAGVVGAMTACLIFIRRRLGWLGAVSIGTLVLSASTTGFVLAAGLATGAMFPVVCRLGGLKRIGLLATAALAGSVFVAFAYTRFQRRLQFTGGSEDAAVLSLEWLFSPTSFNLFGHDLSSLPEFVSYDYFGIWMGAYLQAGFVGLLGVLVAHAPIFFANPFIAGTMLLAKIKLTYPLAFVLIAVAAKSRPAAGPVADRPNRWA